MNFKINLFIIIFLLLSFNILFSDTAEDKTKSDPFSQKSFIPDISFIFDFAFIKRMENEDFTQLSIPGFLHSHTHEGHSHGILKNGFNVSYGELSLYSAVDPYFDLFTTFHLSDDSFEIEEVYIRTQKLPIGFQLKLGKFLSSFGRINSQHAHYWSFFENPLIYNAVFGDHGYLEKGIQINWIAPIDLYLSIGFEVLEGDNENCFGTEGFQVIDHESKDLVNIESSKSINSMTFFLKSSVDIGDLTLLYGTSYIRGKARSNHFDDEVSHGFYGDTEVIGFDLTAKYFIDSYRYLSFQTEYIDRNMSGTKYITAEKQSDTIIEVESVGFKKKQGGFYSQFLFRFNKLWRMGFRYDRIIKNNAFIDSIKENLSDGLFRTSIMLEYSPTEFSRIRLQYNRNNYQYIENVPVKNNELILNFNFSIGAHGAHSF